MGAVDAPVITTDGYHEKGCPGRGDRGGGQKETRMSGAGDPFHSQTMTLFR